MLRELKVLLVERESGSWLLLEDACCWLWVLRPGVYWLAATELYSEARS